MEHAFWHDRWQNNQIGFHEAEGNPLLVHHFGALALPPQGKVFVPLCGKTRDIAWLRAQGCQVVGAELSELAVQQLFAEMGVTPDVAALGSLTRYAADGVSVYVGDIFALDRAALGPVDAVFDRAALVALPTEMRRRYADHMVALTQAAPQLLITFVYDQSQMDGPPFSIPAEEIAACYGRTYQADTLETRDVAGGFKGQVRAKETVWLLT